MTSTEIAPAPPRRLHAHIIDAVQAAAERMVALRSDPAWRDTVADWVETTLDPDNHRIAVALRVDRNVRGRIDTRSLAVDVYLTSRIGAEKLLTVRARDLLDEHGHPIDARADARTLLLQLGHGIPDSPATLTEESA